MKILLLCNKSPWPPKDGSAAATLNLIRNLSDFNVQITVLALNTPKHFVKQWEIPEEITIQADIQLININTRIDPLRLLLNLLCSSRPYNLERFRSEEFSLELKKMISKNFDLIQIEGLAMYHYLAVIKSLTSVPVVFRPHNIENEIWSGLSREEKNIFRKIYFRILANRIKITEKRVINRFDAVVTISINDLNWFRNEGLDRPSMVFSPGFRVDNTQEPTPVKNHKVCFIGALDWRPNINGLIWFIEKVWSLVLKKVPDAEFYIAGRNASGKTISGFKGINIFYEGEVESSVHFLKDKAVMAVPLFSGSGIRIKILEGMSLGKCIVATPFAAQGIEYEKDINIFLADVPELFADNIVLLLRNDDLRNSTGLNALGNVRKNYNILASSEKLNNFYRELIA